MRRLLILLLFCFSVKGMEDSISEPHTYVEDYFLMGEEAVFDIGSQNELLLEQGIHMSLEEITTWQMIPRELKVGIFSLIPEEIKNLILINRECNRLTKDPFFVKAFAIFLIDKNLEKAVNLYAHAFEQDNEILIQELLNAHLREKIIPETGLELFSKESVLDTSAGPIIINESQDNSSAFIKSIVKFFPQAARKIFIKAASQGNLSLIKICFDNGINIDLDNDYNSDGNNALMEAANNDHIEIVQLVIIKGANVNAKNGLRQTALMISAIRSAEIIAKFLLDHDAKINETNKYGMTALMIASMFGNIAVIKLLLDREANIEKMYFESKICDLRFTPLLIATAYSQEEAVDILLKHGAQVNAADKSKNTPLHFACLKGYYNIVKRLLDEGVNVNAKNKKGQTPLMYAAGTGELNIIKLLINRNADANIQTKNFERGYTALIFACIEGHVDVVKELLPISNINAEDEYGRTALECLLNKFYDIDTIPENYRTIIELLNECETEVGKRKPSMVNSCLEHMYKNCDNFLEYIYENYLDEELAKDPLYWFASITLAIPLTIISTKITNKILTKK